jgi:hypothetical protein
MLTRTRPAAVGTRGTGPVRVWRGILIQSLDPMPRRARVRRAPKVPLELFTVTSRIDERPSTPLPHPRPARRFSGGTRLSNERTFTQWAYAAALAPIRTAPSVHGCRISQLRWCTDDGFPATYLLLRAHRDAAGQQWVELRHPLQPSGQVGWVQREALGRFHTTRDSLVVDRRRLCMEFFTDGRLRWTAPVGVGKPSAPTPGGRFWIQERFKIFDSSSSYWPYAFGSTDYSTLSHWPSPGVIGIHGPAFDAGAIPGRRSDGAITLGIDDDAWLAKHLRLGTPVRVL